MCECEVARVKTETRSGLCGREERMSEAEVKLFLRKGLGVDSSPRDTFREFRGTWRGLLQCVINCDDVKTWIYNIAPTTDRGVMCHLGYSSS